MQSIQILPKFSGGQNTFITANNATVIIEWEPETSVSYNVSVLPDPLEFRLNANLSHLIVLYNTSYRVTLVATLCGQNMNTTAIDIAVNYTGKLHHACRSANLLYMR